MNDFISRATPYLKTIDASGVRRRGLQEGVAMLREMIGVCSMAMTICSP
jgi:hypothetical protein